MIPVLLVEKLLLIPMEGLLLMAVELFLERIPLKSIAVLHICVDMLPKTLLQTGSQKNAQFL